MGLVIATRSRIGIASRKWEVEVKFSFREVIRFSNQIFKPDSVSDHISQPDSWLAEFSLLSQHGRLPNVFDGYAFWHGPDCS